MQVTIVDFPETRVAMLRHVGSPDTEHDSVRKLVAWKLAHRLLDPAKHRHYGLHHGDHRVVPPAEHRVDFCLSCEGPIPDNDVGIVAGIIPAARCALARDVGSRLDNQAAKYLAERWLPTSGETWSRAPVIFHYVNVGPNVAPHEAITDVYLPLA